MKTEENNRERSSADLRRVNKPLVEKKRRERINNCLEQLKSLLLDARKDSCRFSKLEKADILEMTVKHLKNTQRHHMAAAVASDVSVLSKYKAGFSECANEVTRYLGKVEGLTPDTRMRLLNHLGNCVTKVHTIAPAPVMAPTHQAMTSPVNVQPLHVQIPTATPLSSIPGYCVSSGQDYSMASEGTPVSNHHSAFPKAMQLYPTTLTNGQMAFLLHPQNANLQQGRSEHSSFRDTKSNTLLHSTNLRTAYENLRNSRDSRQSYKENLDRSNASKIKSEPLVQLDQNANQIALDNANNNNVDQRVALNEEEDGDVWRPW